VRRQTFFVRPWCQVRFVFLLHPSVRYVRSCETGGQLGRPRALAYVLTTATSHITFPRPNRCPEVSPVRLNLPRSSRRRTPDCPKISPRASLCLTAIHSGNAPTSSSGALDKVLRNTTQVISLSLQGTRLPSHHSNNWLRVTCVLRIWFHRDSSLCRSAHLVDPHTNRMNRHPFTATFDSGQAHN
jgi:hypothetical protein